MASRRNYRPARRPMEWGLMLIFQTVPQACVKNLFVLVFIMSPTYTRAVVLQLTAKNVFNHSPSSSLVSKLP